MKPTDKSDTRVHSFHALYKYPISSNFVRLGRLLLFIISLQAGTFSLFAQSTSSAGLQKAYRKYFPIGVAVSSRALQDSGESALILRNFGSLTPENAMKMEVIHPEENRYDWREADEIVAFAQQHHLKVRGHNLCWHEQAPKWIFEDNAGHRVSKEVLLKRLKSHIETVVSRYKGRVYAWDVVNEAIADDDLQFLRTSLWYQICGEDYIIKAFEYAHAADPKAVLFYNDYNTERPKKRERVYKLLKMLKDRGVPVQAVGLQAHWSVYEPKPEEISTTISRFASLGLQVQITELDVSIYPSETATRSKRPDETGQLTKAMADRQADQYAGIFAVLRKHRKVITGVTFWNISDKYSWLDNHPVKGRKDYPLLFDQNLQPKKAYWNIVDF